MTRTSPYSIDFLQENNSSQAAHPEKYKFYTEMMIQGRQYKIVKTNAINLFQSMINDSLRNVEMRKTKGYLMYYFTQGIHIAIFHHPL